MAPELTLFSATAILFLVIDPLGNVPFFLSALKSVEPRRHFSIILRELIIGFVVLVLFMLFGHYIFEMLQVTQSSLGIAGGIVLFLISIKMIFSGFEKIFEDNLDSEPLIVPLAIPAIAGPASIATAMLFMAQYPEKWLTWILALTLAWFFSGLILVFADKLAHLLGQRGLKAIERLMGMILTVVSVQMLIDGIKQSFNF